MSCLLLEHGFGEKVVPSSVGPEHAFVKQMNKKNEAKKTVLPVIITHLILEARSEVDLGMMIKENGQHVNTIYPYKMMQIISFCRAQICTG